MVATSHSVGREFLIALFIAAPLYLCGTFNHDLWRPAEAREAGIAREMIENGNWVATYLNGHLFLEKPPLYTWALALPLKWIGYRDWVVRIPVFLFTLATLILTFFLARRMLGAAGAAAALVSLASMWLFMEVNHGAMVDNGLVFFTTLAMLACFNLCIPAPQARLWAILFYLSLGAAFLCKGVVGFALVLAGVCPFLLFRKSRPAWRTLHPFLGLLILAIMIGGWLGALWLKGGADYYRVFFIENHLQRFLGKAGPTPEWFYYFPYLLITPFPWTILLPPALWLIWRRRQADKLTTRPFVDFLFWWVIGMFFLLSVAGSKDNQYLMPILPPVAIVCGAWVEYTLSGQPLPRWSLPFLWLFAVLAGLGAIALPIVPMVTAHKLLPGCLAWSLGLGGVAILAWRALYRKAWLRVWLGLGLLAIASGCGMGLWIEGILNQQKTFKPLVGMLVEHVPVKAELWGYDLGENAEGALVFYGRRAMRLESIEKAAALAGQDQPTFILLMSHSKSCETQEELIRTGSWFLIRQMPCGNRQYWLVGNAATSESLKH